MSSMFLNQVALQSVNVTSFDTTNVTNMDCMFKNCQHLTELDLSSFNTNKVTVMGSIFLCSIANSTDDYVLNGIYSTGNNLRTVYVSDLWDVSNVNSASILLFSGCKNIVGGNGTTYSSSQTGSSYAHIDVEGNPGYLTYKSNDKFGDT